MRTKNDALGFQRYDVANSARENSVEYNESVCDVSSRANIKPVTYELVWTSNYSATSKTRRKGDSSKQRFS